MLFSYFRPILMGGKTSEKNFIFRIFSYNKIPPSLCGKIFGGKNVVVTELFRRRICILVVFSDKEVKYCFKSHEELNDKRSRETRCMSLLYARKQLALLNLYTRVPVSQVLPFINIL
jgi:hypothetical protein